MRDKLVSALFRISAVRSMTEMTFFFRNVRVACFPKIIRYCRTRRMYCKMHFSKLDNIFDLSQINFKLAFVFEWNMLAQ